MSCSQSVGTWSASKWGHLGHLLTAWILPTIQTTFSTKYMPWIVHYWTITTSNLISCMSWYFPPLSSCWSCPINSSGFLLSLTCKREVYTYKHSQLTHNFQIKGPCSQDAANWNSVITRGVHCELHCDVFCSVVLDPSFFLAIQYLQSVWAV